MRRVSLGKTIMTASRHVKMLRNKCLKDHGCTVGSAHFYAFIYFLKNPGCTAKQAAETLEYDKTLITKSIKKLTEQGLIMRRTDEEDARCKRIWPTQQGRIEMQKVQAALAEITKIMARGLSKDDIDKFQEILETMQKNILDSIETE